MNSTEVAYIRPVYNSCHSFDGILYSNESGLKDRLTSKPLKCNLNGTLLRVVVNEAQPYCNVLINDGIYSMGDSVETLMIKVLAQKFNFRIEVIYANQSWGAFENGVWIGSVGYLVNKSADIAICDLTKSYDRTQVIDYTEAYSIVPLTFVTLKPGLKSRKWLIIRPFSGPVWISTGFSFLVFAISIQIICINELIINEKIKISFILKGYKINKMSSISIALIGALLQQSNIRFEVKNNKIQNLIILWFFSSLILMKTYSGVFYSVLTLPEYEEQIETLSDLERVVANGEYVIITYRKAYYYDYFVTAECCDAYYTIGQSLVKSESEEGLKMPSDLKDGIKMIEQSKRSIFIMTYQGLNFGVRNFSLSSMYISSDTLMIDQLAMAVQKGSPLVDSMNEAIVQFIENGLFIKWMAKTLSGIKAKPNIDESETNKEILDLIDLQSIFYISFIGILFSNFIFICELILFYF